MPSNFAHPGVYIEEVPSGARAITGVATSVAAFVDRFARGPLDKVMLVFSFADVESTYGGLDANSEASYGLWQFFLNGGGEAHVVRVADRADAATATLSDDDGVLLKVKAGRRIRGESVEDPGKWGESLTIEIEHVGAADFNLIVREVVATKTLRQETYRNLTLDPAARSFAIEVVNNDSLMVQLEKGAGATLNGMKRPNAVTTSLASGNDGGVLTAVKLKGDSTSKTGIYALEDVDVFNTLCIPAAANLIAHDAKDVYTEAITFCEPRRAFVLIDIPATISSPAQMNTWMNSNDSLRNKSAAVYFPRPLVPDPLAGNRLRNVGASGTIAGIFARTDGARGVWNAPAGPDTLLANVVDFPVILTDVETGKLNPLGVNCLHRFPVLGKIVWGARTLVGADQAASEWKYIPVRRLALFLEESLFRGTKWVVFEANNESLWSQIRLDVDAFLHRLFRQGAFQGQTPREAYFVKCDAETTTQVDINLGVVNILIGFAPLKPSEFVVIRIQQKTGAVAT